MRLRIDFIKEHPEHIAEDNAMKFLSDDGGDTYNKCHCESIAYWKRVMLT
jgi:hypothetical protein